MKTAQNEVGDGGKRIYNLFGAFLLPRFHDGPLSTLTSFTMTEGRKIKIKDEIENN